MSWAFSDLKEDQKIKAVMPGNHILSVKVCPRVSWFPEHGHQRSFLELKKNNTGGYLVTVLSFAWSVVLHNV